MDSNLKNTKCVLNIEMMVFFFLAPFPDQAFLQVYLSTVSGKGWNKSHSSLAQAHFQVTRAGIQSLLKQESL